MPEKRYRTGSECARRGRCEPQNFPSVSMRSLSAVTSAGAERRSAAAVAPAHAFIDCTRWLGVSEVTSEAMPCCAECSTRARTVPALIVMSRLKCRIFLDDLIHTGRAC
eukprot:3900465-Prymnesium_polylepis.2